MELKCLKCNKILTVVNKLQQENTTFMPLNTILKTVLRFQCSCCDYSVELSFNLKSKDY